MIWTTLCFNPGQLLVCSVSCGGDPDKLSGCIIPVIESCLSDQGESDMVRLLVALINH